MKSSEANFQKRKLSNGITLVMESHPHVRSVSIGVWVNAGAIYETTAISGISHFIEHMVFKGTEKRSALELATVLESLGGDLNAFTDREYTCFHASALSEHLAIALDVLSDLVLHPTFPREEMERERKVLLQELSMIEESPDEHIGDTLFETVWKNCPLGKSIIGSKASIKAISRNSLLKYFREYYFASNTVISIAGNINFEQAASICEQRFGGMVDKPQTKKALKRNKFHSGKRHVMTESEQLHLLVSYEGVGFRDPSRFEALVLSFFLGGGMSSRLFQEIREKAALAYTVDCECVPFTEDGLFSIYCAMNPKSIAKTIAIVGRELRQLKEKPIEKGSLDIVKGQLRGTILLSNDHMETRQESLGRNEIVFGRYVGVDEVVSQIEKVTAEGIQQLAQRVFVPSREAVVSLGGKRPALAGLRISGE